MSEKERPQLIIDYEANTDKLVRLGDVVDQFKGKAVPAKAEPGEFAVINLSDMTSNGIAYDNLKTFSEERRKLLRFLYTARGFRSVQYRGRRTYGGHPP